MMDLKQTEEIDQLEEALNEVRMSLKKSVTAIRILEGRLRRLKNAVEKGGRVRSNAALGRKPKGQPNPLQLKLNSMPLEERQKFFEELKS